MAPNKALVFLVKKLGTYQKRNNGEYGFECPKCSEQRGKFHLGINIKKGVFNCFRCKYSGSVRLLGLELESVKDKKVEIVERLQLPALPDFVPYGSPRLPKEIGQKITEFLRSRDISVTRAVEMGVGYSTDPKLSGRLLLPIVESGAVRYWVARLIASEVPSRATGIYADRPVPKEIGPRNGLGWDKRSDVLYGLDEVPFDAEIILTEGIFDAEHLKYHGYTALSTLGSNISDVQIGKILAKRPSMITVFFDGDEGGRKGAQRTRKMLKLRYRGGLRVIDTDDGIDPDDCDVQMLKRYLD